MYLLKSPFHNRWKMYTLNVQNEDDHPQKNLETLKKKLQSYFNSGNYDEIELKLQLQLELYTCMWIDIQKTEDGIEYTIVIKPHFEEFKENGKPILIKAVKKKNPTTLREMCLNEIR